MATGTKFISIPLDLLLDLRVTARRDDKAAIDIILAANRERIDAKLKEQRIHRTRWAYQRLFLPYRKRRPDLTEAQAHDAFKFSTEPRRKVAEAYEALLIELGHSSGRYPEA